MKIEAKVDRLKRKEKREIGTLQQNTKGRQYTKCEMKVLQGSTSA
jgi:hypothetical protein